jgi:hypothetical protein
MTDPERCNYLYVYVNRPAYRCNGRKGDHPIGYDGQDYHSYVPREGENVTKECPCPECRQFEPMASPAEIMYAHEDRLSDGFGFYGGREAVEHVVELMLAAKDAEIAEMKTPIGLSKMPIVQAMVRMLEEERDAAREEDEELRSALQEMMQATEERQRASQPSATTDTVRQANERLKAAIAVAHRVLRKAP